jgi:hypothetical protein
MWKCEVVLTTLQGGTIRAGYWSRPALFVVQARTDSGLILNEGSSFPEIAAPDLEYLHRALRAEATYSVVTS